MVSLLIAVSLLSLISSVRSDASHVPSGGYLPPESSGGHIVSVDRGIDYGIGSGIGVASHIGLGGFRNDFGAEDGVVVGDDVAELAGGFGDDLHFYSAPEEDEYSHIRVNIVPNHQRNNAAKSIFVRAPSYGVVPEVVAPTLQEDKTRIYLLSQRPDQSGQINLPAGIGTVRGKPEVQFIKYNNAHDAEAKISGALHGHHTGSHVADAGGEHFVRSLDFHGARHGPVVTNVVQSNHAYGDVAARHVASHAHAHHGVERKYLPAGH